MVAKRRGGSRPGNCQQNPQHGACAIAAAVSAAIGRGFVVGQEVLLGSIPGIVVGYNIASFGQFVGAAYPLVVRTALGVTKCGVDEVSLA